MAWKKASEQLPKSRKVVDLWFNGRRHTNYRYVKSYGGNRCNNFFEPVKSGICCVRAEDHADLHWRSVPTGPREES